MVKKRKSKKVYKSKIRRTSAKKGFKENRTLIYGLAAVIAMAFIVMAFPGGNQKKDVKRVSPAKEVKEKKVSDIKETKEVKLNLPKKTKAINTPSFNEKAVQIRFAEIDYNSNKRISLREYLYYFKDKAVGKRKFKSIDKNKDKSITYDEYLASRK